MSPGDANTRKPTARQAAAAKKRLDKRAEERRPSKTQREDFLELIRSGFRRDEAAKAVGSTGSRFRRMCRVEAATYDRDFHAAYAEALEQQESAIIEKLDDLALERIADTDTASDRALHNERIYRNPEYRAAHRQGPSVSVTTEMEVTHVHIDGEVAALRQQLAEVIDLDARRVAGSPQPALTA